ncbi:Pip5kl1 [Symbiodinium pilosum]|uniref:Pip5kl1 protein n=1 Tax=Symbiodinium pilosum TaxID=2952 RepID=A0A812XPW7_SYMPI|nr:Pip5kl1 [Symbiodinium pilosum]
MDEGFTFHSFGLNLLDRLRKDVPSLSDAKILKELGDPGSPCQSFTTNSRSGAVFLTSANGSFIIKTISRKEAQALMDVMPKYVQRVCGDGVGSMLGKYLALFRLNLGRGGLQGSRYITIMQSVMDPLPQLPLLSLYDLKGCAVGRHVLDVESEFVRKDQNWLDDSERLQLSASDSLRLRQMHDLDTTFLSMCNIMDYSILVGVGLQSDATGEDYGAEVLQSADKKHFYFIGIIDFLVEYGLTMRLYHLLKHGMPKDCVVIDPDYYAERQRQFFREVILDPRVTEGCADSAVVAEVALLPPPYYDEDLWIASCRPPVQLDTLLEDCQLYQPDCRHFCEHGQKCELFKAQASSRFGYETESSPPDITLQGMHSDAHPDDLVANMLLIGAAVLHDALSDTGDFPRASLAVRRITAFYSKNDAVLAGGFSFAEVTAGCGFKSDAAMGFRGMSEPLPPDCSCVDVSSAVPSHNADDYILAPQIISAIITAVDEKAGEASDTCEQVEAFLSSVRLLRGGSLDEAEGAGSLSDEDSGAEATAKAAAAAEDEMISVTTFLLEWDELHLLADEFSKKLRGRRLIYDSETLSHAEVAFALVVEAVGQEVSASVWLDYRATFGYDRFFGHVRGVVDVELPAARYPKEEPDRQGKSGLLVLEGGSVLAAGSHQRSLEGLTMSSHSGSSKWKVARLKFDAVYRMTHATHVLHTGLPDGLQTQLESIEDLADVKLEDETVQQQSLIRRATTRQLHRAKDTKPFVPAAVLAVVIGVASVVPYNMVLRGDPGSPLFISFCLHLAIIGCSLPRATTLIRERSIPFRYHAAIVLLGCSFVSFKSDAYVRLPASLCMMLSNLRMMVGVVVQYLLFRKRYSIAQLSGVLAVTVGIAWASQAMQAARATQDSTASSASASSHDFTVGCLEVLASSVSLALLSSTVKISFEKFGENVEEQIFIQHLAGIFIVFPSQWDKVGPRIVDWYHRPDWWLIFNLVLSVTSTFAARAAAARMAGRSPSLLMTQLVQTIECFSQLLLVALIRAPPYPPFGFWGGTVVLLLGTLQYLRASADVPKIPVHADELSAPAKEQ